MWGLYGLFGLITKLLQRLTQTRADNLDKLDDTTTSRAPADTALSTTNWPGTRQDLVNLNAQVSGQRVAILLAGSYLSDNVDLATRVTNTYNSFSHLSSSTGTGSNSGQDWETIINATGPGSFAFLCAGVGSSPSAPNWNLRVTIDGVVVFDQSLLVGITGGVDSKTGVFLIGGATFEATSPYEWSSVTYEDVRFLTSFLVEVKRNTLNTYVRIGYKYCQIQ